MATLIMAIQAVMTTPTPKLTPDISDLNYQQLETKNIKTQMNFLEPLWINRKDIMALSYDMLLVFMYFFEETNIEIILNTIEK